MFSKHVSAKLSAYCNGELSNDETKAIAEHLLVCKGCRKAYDEINLGVQLAQSLPQVVAPASLWSEIENLLDAPQPLPSTPRFGFPFTWQKLVFTGALAMALVACGVSLWLYFEMRAASWQVVRLDGAPKINKSLVSDSERFSEGELLETDANSRARINLTKIGHVDIDPNSRVKVISTKFTEQRLALERGKLSARISAPPRIFFVDTPSAKAVDLGCAYTLEVDDNGRGLLQVTSGWVALEYQGREARVPAGAACETRPQVGPGTPFFSNSTAALQKALERFDFENGGIAALETILAEATTRDTLTLFNLLYRVDGKERASVYDKLASLVLPPDDVTRDGILTMNAEMIDSYRTALEPVWISETFPALRKALRNILDKPPEKKK
ncbi:MAG: FecR domain-containing protein [Acidobacteriota bacterium]